MKIKSNSVDHFLHRYHGTFVVSVVAHVVVLVVAGVLVSGTDRARGPETSQQVTFTVPQHLFFKPPLRAGQSTPQATSISPEKAVGFRAGSFRSDDVKIGDFDKSFAQSRPIRTHEITGDVVVGGFPSSIREGRASGPIGAVGFAAVFDQQSFGSDSDSPGPGGDESARLLFRPTPNYSEEARRLNVSGEVLLEVELLTSGKVHVLRVIHGPGHGLEQAAVEALNQSTCRPARKFGVAIDVRARVSVVFKLV